jgi:hypothetical protein
VDSRTNTKTHAPDELNLTYQLMHFYIQ